MASPASATPKPTLSSVMTKLATVSRKAEQLTEQFNKANADVVAKQKLANAAVAAASVAQQRYEAATGELRQTLVDSFKVSPMSATGALFNASSSQQYLDQLALMAVLTHHRAGVEAAAQTSHGAAVSARQAAQKQLADARSLRTRLATKRAAVKKQQAKVKALLATLTATQKTRYFTGGRATVTHWTPVPAPSKLASIAVNFALAQRGKPYVWGAAGPGSYDCSGLTMAAWGAAGVHLSHYAPTQFTAGHHVAESALAPGDLVFFYPGIQHVAMYIGNGMVVHAPTTGDVVRIAPLSSMQADYQGAVRLP